MDKSDQNYLTKLGHNIARIRNQKMISQDALYLDSGVSRGTIFRIEGGHVNPQILTLKKIANALDVDLSEIVKTD